MIQLSNSPNLQIQIIESISIIAQADFPESWDTLIDVRYPLYTFKT